MEPTSIIHDPQAKLDYSVDWTDELRDGETITTSTWTVTTVRAAPSDVVPALSDLSHDGQSTTVWVEGGTVGSRYRLTNHVVTTDDRRNDRSHFLECQDR